MSENLFQQLQDFGSLRKFLGQKGPLCVALVITRKALREGLPLDASKLVTGAKGQVLGLGRSAVQNILKEYGIDKVLASEGGRTSRGSIGNMQDYVTFLNAANLANPIDLKLVEEWWIERAKEYFDASPIKLRLDASASLKACLGSIFDEASRRQAANPGATTVGAIMQHLVGANLDTLYPDLEISHSGYSVADEPTGRSGDFEIGDCVIHVTTAPSDALIQKCSLNLDKGLRPLIVTSAGGALLAINLAANRGLQKRIEVLDIDQFLVTNVLEWSRFDGSRRRAKLEDLISSYNRIVAECETDASLRIEVA